MCYRRAAITFWKNRETFHVAQFVPVVPIGPDNCLNFCTFRDSQHVFSRSDEILTEFWQLFAAYRDNLALSRQRNRTSG